MSKVHCPDCGEIHGVSEACGWTSPLINVKPDGTIEYVANTYRIEALRAASRIVAGACRLPAGATRQDFEVNGKSVSIDQWTLYSAEQFARWLETGER